MSLSSGVAASVLGSMQVDRDRLSGHRYSSTTSEAGWVLQRVSKNKEPVLLLWKFGDLSTKLDIKTGIKTGR